MRISTTSPSVAPSPTPPPLRAPELLLDASATLPRLLDAVDDAQHVIDISMYAWKDSGSGAQLARAVERKAREGVEVNVMLDGRGSRVAPGLEGTRLVDGLRAAGVNVIVNASLLPFVDDPVDHGKAFSIDGRIGFVGGMNLSAKHDGWNEATAVLGPAGAVALGRDFLERWTARGGRVSPVNERLVLHPAREPEPDGATVLANRPGQRAQITDAYLGAIAAATDRVWVGTPFLGSQAMVDALAAAARRGTDVRLFTNGPRTTGRVAGLDLLGAGFYDQLVRAGAKVYQYGAMTHAKVLLADDAAFVGSFNLTRRSADLHHELAMRSQAPSFVGPVAAMFDAQAAAAHLVTPEDLRRPGQRVVTAIRTGLHLQY